MSFHAVTLNSPSLSTSTPPLTHSRDSSASPTRMRGSSSHNQVSQLGNDREISNSRIRPNQFQHQSAFTESAGISRIGSSRTESFGGKAGEIKGLSELQLAMRDHSDLFPTYKEFVPQSTTAGEKWNGQKLKPERLGLGVSFDGRGFQRSRGLDSSYNRHSSGLEDNSMDPFASFELKTPTSDSFTFHPSPSFAAKDDYIPSTGSKSLSTLSNRSPRTNPISSTPPRTRTISDSSTYRDVSPFSPSTPPRLRTPSFSAFSPTDSEYSFSPSMNRSGIASIDTPRSSPSTERMWSNKNLISPLSEADSDLVAELHSGRRPSMAQCCPPDEMETGMIPIGKGVPEIVNTGNQGPMIVQVGDWMCGVCTFVNWRRRKICMRCFPYSNEIGKVITINSHRVSNLAATAPAFISTKSLPKQDSPTPPVVASIRSRAFSVPQNLNLQNYQNYSPEGFSSQFSSPVNYNYSSRTPIPTSTSNGRLFQPQF